MTIRLNIRVRFKRDVDRYPHFIIRKGEEGVVVVMNDSMVAVQLDRIVPEAEFWANQIQWTEDSLESVHEDIEVITHDK